MCMMCVNKELQALPEVLEEGQLYFAYVSRDKGKLQIDVVTVEEAEERVNAFESANNLGLPYAEYPVCASDSQILILFGTADFLSNLMNNREKNER